MIGISTLNIDNIFLEKLNTPYILIKDLNIGNSLNIDGLFIDWVPKISIYKDAWIKQASLLQTYIKSGIPIVIFDRRFSLTEKESKWCKKFNVNLFEPALNSDRSDFSYLPEWISNYNISLDDKNRIYDLVYYDSNIEDKLKEFEMWIREYAVSFQNRKVGYSTHLISEFKKEEYKKNNIDFIKYNTYKRGNVTVAFDSKESYRMGYFNPIYFYAMNMGCLPFLPSEHKYFHGLFKGLIVDNIKDIDNYMRYFIKVKNILIEEIFDRIKKEWEEFTVDYAVDIIKRCYE